jgi:signal transduction histidine kinase
MTLSESVNRKLLALDSAVLAISQDLSLEETLRRIVRTAAELSDARYAALGVPNESGEFLIEFVTTGLTPEQETAIGPPPRGHGLLGLILREGQTLRLRDLREHPASSGFPPNHPLMTSFLGMPIVRKGRRLGDLYLTDKLNGLEFTDDDQRLIEMLAAHAGIAIENAQLYEAVQTLSVIEERQRIGMDLHDGVIQSIYAVGLTLEVAKADLADGEIDAASSRLNGALDALNTTIRDIRTYILDLRPPELENQDFGAALQRLLREFQANTLMKAELRMEPGTDQDIPIEMRNALFHIAQEALSNAARHSRASRVEVALFRDQQRIVLRLRDNGRGFLLEATQAHLGHGLRNMRDRAVAFGGETRLTSHPGQGTEIVVRVPGHRRAERRDDGA